MERPLRISNSRKGWQRPHTKQRTRTLEPNNLIVLVYGILVEVEKNHGINGKFTDVLIAPIKALNLLRYAPVCFPEHHGREGKMGSRQQRLDVKTWLIAL